jgi:hypothetical protein
MEKNTQWIVVTFAVLSLLVGALFGAVLIPTEKEVLVPNTCPELTCPDVPAKIVNVSVEVEKDFDAYKDTAVQLCLEKFLDDKSYDKYQEVVVGRVSDNWNIVFDVYRKEDRTTVSIDNIEIKILDTLRNRRQTENIQCSVAYRTDTEPRVVLS